MSPLTPTLFPVGEREGPAAGGRGGLRDCIMKAKESKVRPNGLGLRERIMTIMRVENRWVLTVSRMSRPECAITRIGACRAFDHGRSGADYLLPSGQTIKLRSAADPVAAVADRGWVDPCAS